MNTVLLARRLNALLGAAALAWALLGGSTATAKELPDFTGLVEKYSPAVVNVSTTQKSDRRGDGSGGNPDMDEFFRRFFGPEGRGPQGPDGGGGAPFGQRRSLGSGFIISAEGYILTNNHVVEDADEIVVRMNDRRELVATLVGADPRSDLALLKVNAANLPVVKLGHSNALKPGEWVLAIGSPFGFDYSVTAGIISAIGRSLPTENNENYVPFIQTDVAINPGNSGGPLFNLDGEVIGINSQIYTRSGGFMGVSFAIPVDVALDVVEQLKAHGKVSRGWLGVVIQEVNRDLAESFGLDKPSGALVARVIENGPAAKAGLHEGDIILQFNGQHVDLSSDLPHFVGRAHPGSEAQLVIMRAGKRETLNIVVGELAALDEGQVAAAAPGAAPGAVENRCRGGSAERSDSTARRCRSWRARRRSERTGSGSRHPRRRYRDAPQQSGDRFTCDLLEGGRLADTGTLGAGADRARYRADIPGAARPGGMIGNR